MSKIAVFSLFVFAAVEMFATFAFVAALTQGKMDTALLAGILFMAAGIRGDRIFPLTIEEDK